MQSVKYSSYGLLVSAKHYHCCAFHKKQTLHSGAMQMVELSLNIAIWNRHEHIGLAAIETLILSTNVDQKKFETKFSIAICRPTGDKWQSKTLFLVNFDPRSSIVKTFSIAAYPV